MENGTGLAVEKLGSAERSCWTSDGGAREEFFLSIRDLE